LIINLRTINENFDVIRFKMESIAIIAQAIRKGMWATSLDLVSGYSHLKMDPRCWKLLGFKFKGVHYLYSTLPFGLNIAPREFSKVVGAVICILRLEGILVFFYLDNVIILGLDQETTRRWTIRTVQLFQELVFIISKDKSVLEPVQKIDHLGVTFDLAQGLICLTPSKVDKIRCLVQEILPRKTVEISRLAKIIGQVLFAAVAVPWVKSCLHKSQMEMVSAVWQFGWKGYMKVSDQIRVELQRALQVIMDHNSIPFELDSQITIMASDSSKLAYGGVHNNTAMSGQWPTEMQMESINMLELLAAKKLIHCAYPVRQETMQQIHSFIDNRCAMSYLNKGYGKIPALNEVAHRILVYCMEKNVWVRRVSYVPTKKNVESDNLSRMTEKEFAKIRKECLAQSWRLSDHGFEQVNHKFGPFTVERFASSSDRHTAIPRFCSRGDVMNESWEDPITLENWSPDAFLESWTSQTEDSPLNNYCVPPLALILRSVMHY